VPRVNKDFAVVVIVQAFFACMDFIENRKSFLRVSCLISASFQVFTVGIRLWFFWLWYFVVM